MACLDGVATSHQACPVLPSLQPMDHLLDMGAQWEVWWDGSHHPDERASIGSTLGCVCTLPYCFKPLFLCVHLNRVEALGSPLVALLLTGCSDLGPVFFHGDSAHVMHLLDKHDDPADFYLFNCIALAQDLPMVWPHSAIWHHRSENATCDALAWEATSMGMVQLAVGDFLWYRGTHGSLDAIVQQMCQTVLSVMVYCILTCFAALVGRQVA